MQMGAMKGRLWCSKWKTPDAKTQYDGRDSTYILQRSPVMVNVTWKYDDGDVTDSCWVGRKLAAPKAISRKGFNLTGWADADGKTYAYPPEGGVTLYPQFVEHDHTWNKGKITRVPTCVSKGEKLLGVSINVKDAIEIINCDSKSAKIEIEQDEYVGKSRNVILDIPGEISDTILLTAHYDSTSLSQGAYDNMSGSIGLLAMAEYFSKNAHRYSLRFIWCGSEERGLLGAKAYCADHAEELSGIVLNVNLDMIGCIMGKFIACCTSEKALVDYIGYMGKECGFQVKPYQGVYSSDSTPFSDNGVPSVSFARSSPSGTATIHNRYDTLKVMKAEHMQKDIEFITAFVSRMSNAKLCPVSREIPDNMKERLDEYLLRKRKD